jgi:radical SAM protein with 4Fe4S-binding SPASM domain
MKKQKIGIVPTIQVLKSTIGNPITRKIISSISCWCEKCQKNRLEVALELWIGQRKDACWKCKAAEVVLAKVLKSGRKAFGISEEDMKKKFEDAHWRKGLVSVLRGIAKFGINRTFVPGAPFLVVWDVTYACNLRCKHCYATAGKPLPDELNTEEAKRAIDKLDRAGDPILAFSGGEPLVRRDILELSKYAADKGMYVAMATNGTLITREMAKKMKNAGIQFVQISLDGADAKTHDEFRGIPGAFDKTIEGIKNCVKQGFFVNISTTATHYDYKQTPLIIDLCEKLGVKWCMAYNFVPVGRGNFIKEADLTPKEREELLKMLWEKLKTSKVNVLTTAPQFARVALQREFGGEKIVPTHFYTLKLKGQLADLAEFIGGCGCGRFYCAIRPQGNIEPCVFFPLTIGNIKNDDFEELWETNKIFQELRNKDRLKANCGNCDYRYYCGGCRARAYNYFGDYMAPDPGCINNKEFWRRLKK